ncbi:MAG: HPr family phosphocarrier protein [Propionibacteriaceae bacterium]|jgi:phosphocarrier protein FPr|nr:HPr family phosphocarrier protein [Propionibacteriaceae bacterium]
MIGIVVVSHSRALAQAAVELAAEMVPPEARPTIKVAAGLDEPAAFGTDAMAIADAIGEADSPDGVLVLVDLGSAVLSSEMALEWVDPGVSQRTLVCPAPFVEGLVAATVTASTGADLATVAAEAKAGLSAKLAHLEPETPLAQPEPTDDPAVEDGQALTFETVIDNPHGLHARPAANLVAGLRGLDVNVQLTNSTRGKGPAPASSLAGVTTLGLSRGDTLAARLTGPDRKAALERLRQLAETNFGEDDDQDSPVQAEDPGETAAPVQTGRQIVVGPVAHLTTTIDLSAYRPGDPDVERDRLDRAIAQVVEHLQAKADASGRQGGIFRAQAVMLDDPELLADLRSGVAGGASAVAAVSGDLAAVAAELGALEDPYLRERAQDVRGLARQITAELVGVRIDLSTVEGILVVDELDPLTAASLDPTRCLGVITCSGGATGHGVIVAGARGLPVVTGQAEAADIPDHTVVGLDPVGQVLWINPTMAQLAEIDRLSVERRNEATLAAELCHRPAVTRSGRRVLVEANIASLTDAKTALANGADGSGLVRTEVLFADWDHAPSAAEQADVYKAIGRALDGRMITIRTWDPGGDKALAFLPQADEPNPMLGERGIRAMRRWPDLLCEQLKAIVWTSRRTPVRVMFPMIVEPQEMLWASQILSQARSETGGQVAVGMMVETPAAAVRAADFVDLVDFISIGSNDLAQYTMAADRGNGAVGHLAQADQPAVWDLIDLAARSFSGRPVAVCGDIASRPELTPRLIEAGVTELSVRPPLIGLVKLAVRTRA